MSVTNILQWNLPIDEDTSWYDRWVALMDTIDQDMYAPLEDAHFIVYGGGTISLNPSTHEVTWTDNLDIYSVLFQGRLRIAPGSISGVTDGNFLIVSLSRPLQTITTGNISTISALSTIRDKTFIAQRRGDALFFHQRYYSVITGT